MINTNDLKLKFKVFTEKANKIGLRSNSAKRMQSIDSIETYPYGTKKDLICKKEENKCKNIMKQCKESLTLIILQKKIQTNIIQVDQKLPIFRIEY